MLLIHLTAIDCKMVCATSKFTVNQNDFVVSKNKKIPVNIPLNEIGLLVRKKDEKIVAELVRSANGRFKRKYPNNILIFVLDQPKTRKDLAKLSRKLHREHAGIVRQAGLVVIPEGAEAPMILTDELVVQFLPDTDKNEIERLFKVHAVQVVKRSPFVKTRYVLRVTERSDGGALEISRYFEKSGLVKFAHPNFIPVKIERETIPDDPLFSDQWHHRNTGQGGGTIDADIDSSHAWDFTTGDAGVLIAVIDSGVGYDEGVTHADLLPNLWVNPGETAGNGVDDDGNGFIDDINGWDFGDNNGVIDPSYHAAASAGCAAARGNNAQGVSGSCPNCSLMLIMHGGPVADDADAIDYARMMGADIITNSWGYAIGTPSTAVVETAVDNAAALGRSGLGSIVFFAMTNTNSNNCTGIADISSIDNVIAVSSATNQDTFHPGGWGDCMDVLGPTDGGTLGIVTTGDGVDTEDYIMDFTGNSAATPIVAGIAGLILDLSSSLTRLQVQRLLQDTADKIDDSAAGYRLTDGFSKPGGADATHGYGRVNGFEAVRIVAPATDGGNSGVDIMLRDNRLDWGNTEQASNILLETVRGFIPHWHSVDIKVDAPPFESSPPTTSADFEAFPDENPIESQLNRVYIRVRNRGPASADSVTVKLHWTFAGTALPSLPEDFWSTFPGDSIDTSIWHPLGTREINDLGYSGSSVAGTTEDNAQIVQFVFSAPAIDPSNPNPRHHCLLAVVDSPQDPVSDASKGSRVVDWITPRDNNVTHKNVQLQNFDQDKDFSELIYIGNPFPKEIESLITYEGPKSWKVSLDKLGLNRPFRLNPHERVMVSVRVRVPRLHEQGKLTIFQKRIEGDENTVIGGITFAIHSTKELPSAPKNLRVLSYSTP
jgi:hypothetical protein